MIRIFLLYILPLLFPAAVYFLWVKLRNSEEKDGEEPRNDPWFWLILAGLMLMGAALAVTAVTDEKVTEGAFEPDRLEGGRIVPGGVESLSE